MLTGLYTDEFHGTKVSFQFVKRYSGFLLEILLRGEDNAYYFKQYAVVYIVLSFVFLNLVGNNVLGER